MADITLIPTEELHKDLDDSYADILACEAALKLGIKEWSGGTVEGRLKANKRFVEVISAELSRRGLSSVSIQPQGEMK